MKQNKQSFYKVTMTVEVERTVLASSESDAINKVDTSDMIYEIKNYSFDEEISAEKIEYQAPTAHDIIDDIGQQIVRDSYLGMHEFKQRYQKIRKINEQLARKGERTYEPVAFRRMTDDFLERLRG